MSTYLRTWTVLARINTGPPTWWLPRLRLNRSARLVEVRGGWLRVCVQIGFGSKRHSDEEAAS